ncbi:MAG TPA: ABC transporter permease [Verrucomicrobiae bacterium]|nr:ABC transporter permease [Verrucomicrobiae bacterium]
MTNVLPLLRRELNAYFASVVGYVALMFFLLVMGVTFAVVVRYLNSGPTQMTAMKILFSMFWLPSLVVVPMITMRLLAEEKRAGTLEMLMTAPVTDFEVVLAKYLGAVVLYTMMWALTGFYVLILRHFSGGIAMLDLGPICSGYVGVLVIGQFFIAVGLLASSMTKSQVAAALMSFALVFLMLIVLNWLTYLVPTGPLGKVFHSLSAFDQMEDFERGIVDVRPLVLYLGGTVLALFITTRVVESRKWR